MIGAEHRIPEPAPEAREECIQGLLGVRFTQKGPKRRWRPEACRPADTTRRSLSVEPGEQAFGALGKPTLGWPQREDLLTIYRFSHHVAVVMAGSVFPPSCPDCATGLTKDTRLNLHVPPTPPNAHNCKTPQQRQLILTRDQPTEMANNDFNRYCENLLVQYNRRNTASTMRHIEGLCNTLRRKGQVVQTMFGGSVRRGTYVSGLSDVDVLLIVNQSSLSSRPPADAITYVKNVIEQQLPLNPVRAGNLAVTVNYSDGTEIQVLPAIRRNTGGVRIASPDNSGWSNVVQPDNFARQLVEVNNANGARVVPTVKLAKAIADCFIRQPTRKIAGYHM